MDELITRHLNGTATDIERHTLERWRAAAAENEAAYQELHALWDLSIVEEPDPATAPPDSALVTREAERRRARAGWRARARSPWTGYGLVAAALLVWLWAGGREPGPPPPARLTPTESAASGGDVVTMTLSDGSLVRFGSATTLEFPPAERERLVVLSGRAFFAVRTGADPFVVRTDAGDVTVTGTRFEVSAQRRELRVIVVEGTVSLEDGGDALTVPAGHVAYLSEDRGPRVLAVDDAWSLMEWEGGLLVFQETPLADVAAEIERHFGSSVDVADALAARRVTAWFADEPLDEVASAVCLIAGASCRLESGSLTIRP